MLTSNVTITVEGKIVRNFKRYNSDLIKGFGNTFTSRVFKDKVRFSHSC